MVQLDVLQLAVGTPGRTQADIIITHSHHLADQIGIHQQVIARHTPRFHRHYMSTLGKFLIDHLHCKLIYFVLLIHTFLSHQLRFLGHLLHSDHFMHFMHYMNPHMVRLGVDDLALTTSPTYFLITGHQLSELIELAQNQEDWRQLVVECADPQPPD